MGVRENNLETPRFQIAVQEKSFNNNADKDGVL